jgi:Zn/Cd-binding protein ZinT
LLSIIKIGWLCKIAKGVADRCADQTITDDSGNSTVNKPIVDKGTTIQLCKPTEEDKTALRNLTYFEQRNVYLRNVTDLNAEMASIYKSLTRVLPQATRTTLENELSRLEQIKAYITTDRK